MRKHILIIGFFVCLSTLLFSHKLPRHLWRSALITSKLMAIGGSDIASASGIDIFSQNPALLYTAPTPSIREGYKRYLDEDAIFFVRESDNLKDSLPIIGNMDLTMNVNLFTKRDSLSSIINYVGQAPTVSALMSSIPVLGSLVLSYFSLDTNANSILEGTLTTNEVTELNDAIFALQNLNIALDFSIPYFEARSRRMGVLVRNDMHILINPTGEEKLGFHWDVIATDLSFASRLPKSNRFFFGITLRAFMRMAIEMKTEEDLFAIVNNLGFILEQVSNAQTSPTNFLAEGLSGRDFGSLINEGIYPTTNLIEPFHFGHGFSSDVGMLFRAGRNIKIAAVIQDIVSGIIWYDGRADSIPVNMVLGTTLFLPSKWELKGFVEDARLIVNVSDIFARKYDNFFLKLHIGAEASLFNRFLVLGLGINQGYFSAFLEKPADFNFLRYTPVLKGIAPRREDEYRRFIPRKGPFLFFPFSVISDLSVFPAYKPVFIPLNIKDLKRFMSENALMWSLSWLTNFLLRMNVDISVGMYGYELGLNPGASSVYQTFFRISASYNDEN